MSPRLDADEQRALVGRVRALGRGDDVEMVYESRRSGNDKTIEGVVYKREDGEVFVDTTDVAGEAVVSTKSVEDRWRPKIDLEATKPRTRSPGRSTLGELIDVEEAEP